VGRCTGEPGFARPLLFWRTGASRVRQVASAGWCGCRPCLGSTRQGQAHQSIFPPVWLQGLL